MKHPPLHGKWIAKLLHEKSLRKSSMNEEKWKNALTTHTVARTQHGELLWINTLEWIPKRIGKIANNSGVKPVTKNPIWFRCRTELNQSWKTYETNVSQTSSSLKSHRRLSRHWGVTSRKAAQEAKGRSLRASSPCATGALHSDEASVNLFEIMRCLRFATWKIAI